MEIIEPWRTVIAKHRLTDEKLLDELTEELLTCPFFAESRRVGNVLDEIYTPKTNDVMGSFVKPAVVQYLKDICKYTCKDDELRSCTWGNMYNEGDSLDMHVHPNCILVTVMYLTNSNAPLTLIDPKGNACRGHPSEIIRSSFSNHRIIPKAGDLYIFPSYLQHFVVSNRKGMRVSLASDFYLEDDD